MPSPFKQLAEESKVTEKAANIEMSVIHKTTGRFTKENLRAWMQKGKQTKKSDICALLVGDPKIGKSGVLLDALSDEDITTGKQMIIFEMNSDQGCDVNKKLFHAEKDNIMILNPREYIQDKEGKWVLDYIATMEKIKSTIQLIKEDVEAGVNIKVIAIDGLDIFLSEICESQMRMEEHIDAAGGVAMRFWKNRNKFYYDVINMMLDIDVDKYFITHYSLRSRDDKTGAYNDKRTVSKIDEKLVYNCQKSTTDKVHQVIEFEDQTRIVSGKRKIKIVAHMIADRRSYDNYMKTLIIAETDEDGTVKWNGKNILERNWD